MATIFQNRTEAFDGSGATINGTKTIALAYVSSPTDGGILKIFARPTGSTIGFNLLFDMKFSRIKRFDAADLEYFYTWDPVAPNTVASLEG